MEKRACNDASKGLQWDVGKSWHLEKQLIKQILVGQKEELASLEERNKARDSEFPMRWFAKAGTGLATFSMGLGQVGRMMNKYYKNRNRYFCWAPGGPVGRGQNNACLLQHQ